MVLRGLSTAAGRCGFILVLTDCQGLCPDARVKFLVWTDSVWWRLGDWKVHACERLLPRWPKVPGQGSELSRFGAHLSVTLRNGRGQEGLKGSAVGI